MDNDSPGDWDQHRLLVTSTLTNLTRDVHELRTAQARDTLKLSTEIATLRTVAKHQGRLWGLIAGSIAPLIGLVGLLISRFW